LGSFGEAFVCCLAAGLDFGELSRGARRAPRKRDR